MEIYRREIVHVHVCRGEVSPSPRTGCCGVVVAPPRPYVSMLLTRGKNSNSAERTLSSTVIVRGWISFDSMPDRGSKTLDNR